MGLTWCCIALSPALTGAMSFSKLPGCSNAFPLLLWNIIFNHPNTASSKYLLESCQRRMHHLVPAQTYSPFRYPRHLNLIPPSKGLFPQSQDVILSYRPQATADFTQSRCSNAEAPLPLVSVYVDIIHPQAGSHLGVLIIRNRKGAHTRCSRIGWVGNACNRVAHE